MIDLAVRQLNIPAVPIIFYPRRVGDTMCTRKEACLLIDITYGIVRSISLSLILGEKSDVTFYSCRIFQLTPINGHLLSQVDNGIRRNTIITEMLFGITDLRIPGILFKTQHQRTRKRSVDGLPQQSNITKQHIHRRNQRRGYINHPAHSITTVK